MKQYYNKQLNKHYIEGQPLMVNIDKNTTWHGIPTEEQLVSFGYEEMPIVEISEKQQRLNQIKRELHDMDYLTSKYIDGEDMSAYGNWQDKRKALREEYRKLEEK